ncbi:hypothetical protein V1260_04270 [Brachybacterium sp. J144]|uniref:hypothetical protein n=1 Tax=unclassified Brachybacterium TaxID=2623841 RepID=UPI002E771C93|nr:MULTISPECIES: hypothetical protein [unclassified Brachybacterium]MEE1619601.1 hypothetical protein [Brachybacterium sp. J153]MEE1649998.1 hypothetical protein [Brachybacterium sp. J144]
MSSTPMYHPDDDETSPLPEDQGIAQPGSGAAEEDPSRSSEDSDSSGTDHDERSDDGDSPLV